MLCPANTIQMSICHIQRVDCQCVIFIDTEDDISIENLSQVSYGLALKSAVDAILSYIEIIEAITKAFKDFNNIWIYRDNKFQNLI